MTSTFFFVNHNLPLSLSRLFFEQGYPDKRVLRREKRVSVGPYSVSMMAVCAGVRIVRSLKPFVRRATQIRV